MWEITSFQSPAELCLRRPCPVQDLDSPRKIVARTRFSEMRTCVKDRYASLAEHLCAENVQLAQDPKLTLAQAEPFRVDSISQFKRLS